MRSARRKAEREEQGLDRLTKSNLQDLGFSALRIDNRHRFGWRYWTLTESGHLRSPYARAGIIDAPIIKSQCHAGHAPPHHNCQCGIYYVNNWFPFIDTVKAIDWIGQTNLDRVALTWGVALDGV